MRFLASVFVAALLAATQASAKPEAIEFSDLVDPLAIVFDDPYRDMGYQLLNELKLLIELDGCKYFFMNYQFKKYIPTIRQ